MTPNSIKMGVINQIRLVIHFIIRTRALKIVKRLILFLSVSSHCSQSNWMEIPVGSVDRAMVDQIRRSWLRFPPRSKIFSLPVWSPISLLGPKLSRSFTGSL